jgi:hypothetical protein
MSKGLSPKGDCPDKRLRRAPVFRGDCPYKRLRRAPVFRDCPLRGQSLESRRWLRVLRDEPCGFPVADSAPQRIRARRLQAIMIGVVDVHETGIDLYWLPR